MRMRRNGQILILEEDLTLEHARRLLSIGCEALTQGVNEIDFAHVGKVDSSALSLMLAWLRRAQATGTQLKFRNIPDSLMSLAKLYGVDTLLH